MAANNNHREFLKGRFFGVLLSTCLIVITASILYGLALKPISEKVGAKLASNKAVKEEQIRQANEITVGEEFLLEDGRKLRVKAVTIRDFDVEKESHTIVAFSINSDGELPKEVRENMYLEREDGSVVRSDLGSDSSRGEYEFEFKTEGTKHYFLIFGDGTKVKLMPFAY